MCLFYFEEDKPAQSGGLIGEGTYSCKFGSTERAPETRVMEYVEELKRRGVRVPTTPPILALLFKTESGKSKKLERALHACIKAQDRHIEDETFDTCENDVINLYSEIMIDCPESDLLG